MRQLTHVVHIIADNTDVFNASIIEEVPSWARHLRVQTLYSDYDALIDLVIQRGEYMRVSAPHVFGAANAGLLDWRRPHVIVPVDKVGEYPINLNFNVVTAGEGLVIGMYEG